MPASSSRHGSLARIVAHATRGQRETATFATPTHTEAAPLVDAAHLRVGVYCRYSSHTQDSGFSLEAQHEAAEREAAAVGTWAIRYYDEPATSAYTDDLSRRPMFLRMLCDARDGQLDMVVVHRLDRFSRNMSITTQVVPALLDAGVQFLSLTERLDATTPAGLMMLHTIGAVAQYESGHKAAAVRNGKRQRAKLGLHICRPSYGYRWNGKQGVAEPDMPPDPADASNPASNPASSWNGLMRLFRLAQTSLSDHDIAVRLNAEGYRQTTPSRARNPDGSADTERLFHRATVSFIRRNVYYRPFTPGDTHGTIRHAGQEYRGAHLAALDWDTWQSLQQIAHNRRRGFTQGNTPTRRTEHVPYTAEFRGLAVCADCGHRLYVSRTVAVNGRAYEYYLCRDAKQVPPCPHDRAWARVEDVRGLWLAWVREHLRLPDDWRQIVRERLQEASVAGGIAGELATAKRTAAQRQLERVRWQEKRDRVIEVYAEGLKDRAWMEARVAEADAAMLALERAERPQAVQRTRLLDAGRFLIDIADAWERATTEQRIVLASHLITPGGLHVELRGLQGKRGSAGHAYVFGGDSPPSCAILRVELQPAFRDLLATVGILTVPSGVA